MLCLQHLCIYLPLIKSRFEVSIGWFHIHSSRQHRFCCIAHTPLLQVIFDHSNRTTWGVDISHTLAIDVHVHAPILLTYRIWHKESKGSMFIFIRGTHQLWLRCCGHTHVIALGSSWPFCLHNIRCCCFTHYQKTNTSNPCYVSDLTEKNKGFSVYVYPSTMIASLCTYTSLPRAVKLWPFFLHNIRHCCFTPY